MCLESVKVGSGEKRDGEVDWLSVTGMLNLIEILEFIDDGIDKHSSFHSVIDASSYRRYNSLYFFFIKTYPKR